MPSFRQQPLQSSDDKDEEETAFTFRADWRWTKNICSLIAIKKRSPYTLARPVAGSNESVLLLCLRSVRDAQLPAAVVGLSRAKNASLCVYTVVAAASTLTPGTSCAFSPENAAVLTGSKCFSFILGSY